MHLKLALLLSAALVAVAAVGWGGYQLWWHANYYEVQRTEYTPPEAGELELQDDRLEEKQPPFDTELVDRRPLGDWQVNSSAAVVRLDCPMIKPDVEPEYLILRSSYAAAHAAAREAGWDFLPSANLVDGAAKQLDDGLYARIDLACFRGELAEVPSPVDVMEKVFSGLSRESAARGFLAAALFLADRKMELSASEQSTADALVAAFERDAARSTPISFYTWNDELGQVWRFCRFLQKPFPQADLEIPRQIADVLAQDPELLTQYRAINAFYGQLTNPMIYLSVDVLLDSDRKLSDLAGQLDARHAAVAILPPATSREAELFQTLFPVGAPAGVNLMTELIRRVRSGEVDLAPGEHDGWYQYQVYALETLVLPGEGQEADKLLLTAEYKKRLIEAFKALVTKRRETHARHLWGKAATEALGAGEVRPRLRIEPCATFYLRTARAYAFVHHLLQAAVGPEGLATMHALTPDGERALPLDQQLDDIRQRFYGFYFVVCEDLGMRPELLGEEPVDQERAMAAALAWLENLESDADLARDTRISIPIYIDPMRRTQRLWTTLGVRLAKLEAEYARPPRVRPLAEEGEWQDVERHQLGPSHYVIALDEFAEVQRSGLTPLTRQQWRALCDRHKTKEAMLQALSQ